MKILGKIGLAMVIITAAAGGLLLVFNILDFKIEEFRYTASTSLFYALPIAAVSLAAALAAALAFSRNARNELLWLGSGALAFGIGTLMGARGLQHMNTAVTIKETASLFAAVLFLIGIILSLLNRQSAWESKKPGRTVFGCYLGVIAVLVVIAVLAYLDLTPPFYLPGRGSTVLKGTFQGFSTFLTFISACVCMRNYFVSRRNFSYWYFLGLALFVLAFFFGSQSTMDSALSWTSRFAQFIAAACFLMAIVSQYGWKSFSLK